jgi:HEAT repeat protein
MRGFFGIGAALAALVGFLSTTGLCAAPADGNPRTVYLSTGDNQDLLWPPLDSKVSIETMFDTLQRLYQVERILWRGGQDEVWGNQFVLRPENRSFAALWSWWRYLAYEKVGTNRLAVRAAHQRGMKIWMAYGLFDNGSGPDVGFTGFPYAMEDRVRVEHPEWVPCNRWGTWRQGGPVEFAYPGARKAMVAYLTKFIVAGGYDGVAFLTYAENYSQRYDDEFGFNEPVVAEFKKRHGVDIRKQRFDKAAWSRLRGEYLTEFLRELRAALRPHGKKIAVCVDGQNPELPTPWSDIAGGLRSAGLIHFDLKTWAKEGLVDEIIPWAPRDDEAASVGRCRDLCKGTATAVSCMRTRGPLPKGVGRIMWLGEDVESGFPWESYINFPDEKVPPQPEDTLEKGDAFARRRLLTAVLKKKQKLPAAKLAAATSDADLYVRRLALRALACGGDAASIPAIEKALRDSEHSVRWQAALVLGELAGPRSIPLLFDAIGRDPVSYQLRFVAVPEALKKMQAAGKRAAKDKEAIAIRLTDRDPAVREAALFAFLRIGAPADPAMEKALLKILRQDASAYAREMAIENLRSTFGPTAVVQEALRAAAARPDDAVAVRAQTALAQMGSHPSAEPAFRRQTLEETAAYFAKYGDGCARADKDWGWRLIGAALLNYGSDGEKVLRTILLEKKGRRLPELAWRVLYVKQGDQYLPGSEAEDRAAHAMHPFMQEKK